MLIKQHFKIYKLIINHLFTEKLLCLWVLVMCIVSFTMLQNAVPGMSIDCIFVAAL